MFTRLGLDESGEKLPPFFDKHDDIMEHAVRVVALLGKVCGKLNLFRWCGDFAEECNEIVVISDLSVEQIMHNQRAEDGEE